MHKTQSHDETGSLDKRLTSRQQSLLMIELSWRYHLPWAPPPSKLHACSWLSATQNNIDLIIDVIQQAAERDDVVDPENWVWYELRKYDTRPRYANRRAVA